MNSFFFLSFFLCVWRRRGANQRDEAGLLPFSLGRREREREMTERAWTKERERVMKRTRTRRERKRSCSFNIPDISRKDSRKKRRLLLLPRSPVKSVLLSLSRGEQRE